MKTFIVISEYLQLWQTISWRLTEYPYVQNFVEDSAGGVYSNMFSSDIIAAFLNPKAKHNEGNLFLDAFIDMLNRKMKRSNKNSTPIRKDFYVNALVERERHKIDILITTIDKRHCIIIENKIEDSAGGVYSNMFSGLHNSISRSMSSILLTSTGGCTRGMASRSMGKSTRHRSAGCKKT